MQTETKETPVRGALIYQPQGAAGEYAKWAINLYHGCLHIIRNTQRK